MSSEAHAESVAVLSELKSKLEKCFVKTGSY